MSDTILPPNHTDFEAAMAVAVVEPKPDLTSIKTLMRPSTCPAHLLGWLAWSFSVDVWDAKWPEATKRGVIRESIAVHKVKGTRGAVRRALAGLGFRTEISEWFEYNGPAHTFRIDAFGEDVFDAGFAINAHLFETVSRVIENVKPARSHFDLRIGEQFSDHVEIRTAILAHQIHQENFEAEPRTNLCVSPRYLRVGQSEKIVSETYHDVEIRIAA